MKPLTPDKRIGFNNAIECHLCQQPFAPTDGKHRDHCDFTGKYRGAAHQRCNLNYTKSHSIPIVFHDLSAYDSHFLIKSLALQFYSGITRFVRKCPQLCRICIVIIFLEGIEEWPEKPIPHGVGPCSFRI